MKRSSVVTLLCLLFVVCVALVASSTAQTFETFFGFNGTDGATPIQLVQGKDGNFYGTTAHYGAEGYGTAFKITPAGELTTLYNFCSEANCADGAYPHAGLVQGADGDFYGTTEEGGSSGDGTVFRLTPAGALTTLHNFCVLANCPDGVNPLATLIQASNGNFYGTTQSTIFEITPGGKLTTLYTFCTQAGCPDGNLPGGLIQAKDGNFYGTTSLGGNSGTYCAGDCGTVFGITPTGELTTLYRFCEQSRCPDGFGPNAPLVQGANGNFYGTTAFGAYSESGCPAGCGTIFELTSTGKLNTLHVFCSQSNCADGANPGGSALVRATDGNFYGTASGGGTNHSDTIFRITTAGQLTTLYAFCSVSPWCADGSAPSDLIQATSGKFYGTAPAFGVYGDGNLFSLTLGSDDSSADASAPSH